MSTFEDVETQNGRRWRGSLQRVAVDADPVRRRSRAGLSVGRAIVDNPVFMGASIWEEIRSGDLREWMTMSARERHSDLHRRVVDAYAKHAAAIEPRPSRSPRTALPLLGPWAPPLAGAAVVEWALHAQRFVAREVTS